MTVTTISTKDKEKLKWLLRACLEPKKFQKIKKLPGYEQVFNESTYVRYLKHLEEQKYVFYNHFNRTYTTNKKGQNYLINELDVESRGRYFTAAVFNDLEFYLCFWRLFDTRIPDKICSELFNELLTMIKKFPDPGKYEKILSESNKYIAANMPGFYKKYKEATAGLDKIPDSEIILKPVFFEIISQIVSESVLFISMKFLEDRESETLNLLQSLPHLIASRMVRYNVPKTQIETHITLLSALEGSYKRSKSSTFTPKVYSIMVDLFENQIP